MIRLLRLLSLGERQHSRNDLSFFLETIRRVVSTRKITLQPNSLGSIIGQFKSVCTKRVRAGGFHDFAWQPGYYDRVIRDEKDLERIRDYVAMNPSRWGSDDEFAHNVGMDPIHKGM